MNCHTSKEALSRPVKIKLEDDFKFGSFGLDLKNLKEVIENELVLK